MATLRNRYLNGKPWLLGIAPVSGGTTTYATSFAISAPSAMMVGVGVTVTISPVGGAWNGQTITPATGNLVGSFSPSFAVGSNTSAISFTFTPTVANSGAINASASPSMTSGGAQNVTVSAAQGGGTTPPQGDWDTLTPYSQVAVGWKNASGMSLASPFVTTNHRMQRADVPAGSHLGLFKADGTAIVTQQDNEALPHSDGSLASATISAVLPDTLASTDTGSYFVKAVSGAPNRTPKFTLAAWSAANDLKLRICTNLSNLNDATAQYEFRVSDAVAAGLFEGSSNGSDYPLTSIRVDRSGPVCMGWKFKGYARRVSDGAYSRTLTGEFYVTALSMTDSLIEGMFKLPTATTVGKNPAQTLGATGRSDLAPIFGVVQMINNGVVLRTWGGPSDYRAGPVTIDVGNNQAIFPTSGTGHSRNALGYVFTSTGALPGGVVAGRPYFTYQDYSNERCWFTLRRGYVKQGDAAVYQANHAYDRWQIYGNGAVVLTPYTRQDDSTWRKQQVFACTQGGTTGSNSPPSGTALNQADGTALWEPLNLFFTSAGSGTISVYPVVHVFHTCGATFIDEQTAAPVWTGSGPAPRLEVIKDLTYLCRWARAFPPYDLTLTPLYETGLGFDGFSVGEPYTQATLDDFGDDPGTNLIGYLNVSASNALVNQTSVQVQRHQRAEAYGWADHWLYLEDPKAFQPVVGIAGPGNASGRYPGLAPSLPGFWYDFRGADVAPASFIGFEADINANWYNAKYGTPLDGSHLPAYWILAYEKTGRSIFLDHGIALANGALLSCYKGNNTTSASSRQYYNTSLINQQVRGSGWVTRCLDCLDDVLPANHIMRPYMTDAIQDGLDFAMAVIEENKTRNPAAYAMGTLRITDNGPSLQMWMMAFYLTAASWAAKKARNPGWRVLAEHMASRIYLPFYDSDKGGNEGLIDYNWFNSCVVYRVGSDAVAGDVFSNFYYDNLRFYSNLSYPPNLSYTVQSGQTQAQIAASIVALINGNQAVRDYGYVASDDGGGLFRINAPGGLFNDANNHAQVEMGWNGKLRKASNQVALLGKIDEYLNIQTPFSNITDLLAYNLGAGWRQTATTKVAYAGSAEWLKGPEGRTPWDTTDYPNIHWACMAAMTEAGITKARTIYDRVTLRIQQTGNGPHFSMIPYSRFSPDGTGRTYNNFNLVAYHLQATRTGH